MSMDVAATGAGPSDPRVAVLRDKAQALEALLFAQMLGASGTGPPSATGARDSPFDGLLRQAQAEAVARSARTGLAESIASALMREPMR